MAPHDKLALVMAYTLTSLSTVVVGLRFYTRYFLVGKLSSPDWLMLIALISTWGSTIINSYQIHFLDYTHIFDSKDAFKEVVEGGLLTWWIYRLFYLLDLCLIKISILLFYNYVASSHKSFHRLTKALMVVVLSSTFGLMVAAILSCTPPSDAWNFHVFWDGMNGIFSAHCYNPNVLWYASAGFNLATDCVVWILPIPFVLNLQAMPARRRLELVAIFSIGIVAIVASAIRLWVLVEWSSGFQKQGQNAGSLLIWGQVEQHAGIISASAPFLRPLVRKTFRQNREQQHSPSPAAKLIAPQLTPASNPGLLRTPIIPSPSPTFGSQTSPFRPPQDPLSPISPMQPGVAPGSAL